jgi:hypothetical protein
MIIAARVSRFVVKRRVREEGLTVAGSFSQPMRPSRPGVASIESSEA